MKARQFGPQLTQDGTRFRLWAPAANRVDVLLERPHAMTRGGDGWFTADIAGATAGARYEFRIDDEIDVPDPGSDFQPDDVFGPSEVVDHASFAWRANEWRGRPWQDAVIVEAHVGAFTPAVSYRAMIEHLDHLVETGITALELLPLADFAGSRNWGYDGVLWYAPDSAYGRPEDLKTLIDEAHLRGVMVMLDVVYNHFGPEGNYLGRYAPSFFTDKQTPWGSAIDYRIPQVRAFAIENALYWLRDYRFDGLRLDAVHAIAELGNPSMLNELSSEVGKLAAETGRQIHLVLENDDNTVSLLDPLDPVPHGKYRAQWNDDYHHAWHVLLTDESHGYYRDYQRSPAADVARALVSGFVYQGEASSHRGGQLRGEPSSALSPLAFINFIQNHDQIGNRARGERLSMLASARSCRDAKPLLSVLLLGTDRRRCSSWAKSGPRRTVHFSFFCDFEPELAHARHANGRRARICRGFQEFADPQTRETIPDPLRAVRHFESSGPQMGRTECRTAPGRKRRILVRDLVQALRRTEHRHAAHHRRRTPSANTQLQAWSGLRAFEALAGSLGAQDTRRCKRIMSASAMRRLAMRPCQRPML